MGKVCINGKTADSISVDGRIITCMVKESTHGKMGENMMVNICLIKNMASVFIFGKMADSMKVIGKTVNNMVKDCTDIQMVRKGEADGKTGRE